MIILYVRDVAKILHTTENNTYAMIRAGKIPARKMGKRLIIIKEEFEKAIKKLPRRKVTDGKQENL